LGDVLVRQAISHIVDQNAIIEGFRDGSGIPVATHTIPTSWVYNPDLQYVFDPELAAEKLTEAGWIDDDDDPGTPRVCQGCLYAREVDPGFEGSPLNIRVRVSAGSVFGEQVGEYVASQLESVGFDADFQVTDWATSFLPELDGQTFDIALLAWNLGIPVNPDVSAFYTKEADVPGSGFNFGSFYNAELEELLAQARDPAQTNNCDPAVRAELYAQVQQILYEQMPYLYMHVSESMTAVQPDLVNWVPTPYTRENPVNAWALQPAE
jgi:peptide/nickel transport system substrate-binding protein